VTNLIELPRRRAEPRTFVEPAPDLHRRVSRALDALGDLPESFDLPGLPELAGALIELADELAGDPDDEPEEDCDGEEERLPLLAYGGLTRKP
jgi:hypothetical protein